MFCRLFGVIRTSFDPLGLIVASALALMRNRVLMASQCDDATVEATDLLAAQPNGDRS